jgi:hypothetical protein
MLSVELLVCGCMAGRATSAAICQDACGRLKDVTCQILYGPVAVARYDAREDILNEVFDV